MRWRDLVVAVLCAAALCVCASFLLIAVDIMQRTP